MKRNIAIAFRDLKRVLQKMEQTLALKNKVTKELRYVERSYLLTGIMTQNMVTTLGRIAKLMARNKENLPPDFLHDLIQIFSSLDEQQQAVRREVNKLERSH